MKFNEESFKKALSECKIIRWQNHFKNVVKAYLKSESEQCTIADVSSSITDWLSEEYSREEAEEQVSNAVIRKAQVYVVEYETGMEDIIEFKNGDIKHLNPR